MGDFSLTVEIREGTGKGLARRLRMAGRMPAVLYGHGKQNVSLSLESSALEKVLSESDAGVNTLIDLEGAKEVQGRVVLVKELQRHPAHGKLVHADLFEVDPEEKIHVTVPIHLEGTPAGLKFGGILEQMIRDIDLLCLPTAIPDSIDIDASGLEIGDSLHMSDLELPKSVECSVDLTIAIAHVALPKIVEEEVPEAEEGEEGEVGEEGAEGEGAKGEKDAKGEESSDASKSD